MKFFDQGTITALCAVGLGLGLGMLPGTLSGQTAPKPAGPSTPSISAMPGSRDQECGNLGFDGEQIKAVLRNMRLEEKLSGLSQRLAKEEAMSSPELAKLQNLSAQLEGKQGEIEAQAEAMSASAQGLVSEVKNRLQENGNMVISRDDDSGWLGVEIEEVTPGKAKELKLPAVRGVIVADVEADSPAGKAGLKQNDVILEYDGHAVEGTVQFRRLVRETPPGRTVNIQVSRDGAKQELSVELADRNAYYEKRMRGMAHDIGRTFTFSAPNFDLHGPEMFMWMNSGAPALGIEAEDLTGQLGAYFGAPGDSGVLVRAVREGTPAQKAGLKAGDVIITLDGAPVKSVSGLRDQLREKRDQKNVTLGVLRKGSELKLNVSIEQPKPENFQAIHSATM
jgi:serine protease Do